LLSGPEQGLVQFFNAVANLLHREFSGSKVFVELLKSTIALFVVLNPIGTVPLFIGITQNMKKEERKVVSKTAIITSGIVLVVFAIAGTRILMLFGITIFSFMIAGGVLLFIVAIELLTHGVWRFGGGTLPGESGVVPLITRRTWCNHFCDNILSDLWIFYNNIIYCNCNWYYLHNPVVRKSNLQVARSTWFYDSHKSICNFYSSYCNTVCNRRCQATFRLKDTPYVHWKIKNNLYCDILNA
jgi:hypothetical protein